MAGSEAFVASSQLVRTSLNVKPKKSGSGHIHNNIVESNIDTLQACSFCGRKFIPASLEKHEKICQRTFINKRKVFNSQRQRVKDASKNAGSPTKEVNQTKSTYLKSRWREKHHDLISTVRAARGVAVAQISGKPLPPVPRSLIPSDYILCEFCNRHFSIKAADRHIEWCKEQKSRLGQGPKVALAARERLEARIKYKAPSLRRKSGGARTVFKAATKARSERDCKNTHPPGKPPTRGSVSSNEHSASNVRVSGLSISSPRKPGTRSTNDYGEGPQMLNKRKQMGALIGNRALAPPNDKTAKYKRNNGGYDPYVAAEQQMRDLLLEGEASKVGRGGSRGQWRRDDGGGASSNSLPNDAVEATDRDSHRRRPAPLVRRATIEVREKKASSSGQSAYAYSDSDDESLTPYSERGSGDLRATYTLVSSSDKVNRKRNGLLDESDSSSVTRHRNTPSPPLKLPSANRAKTNIKKNQSQHGRLIARVCDGERRLSTSSSDSSLPPLNNVKNKPSQNGHHTKDARNACFCHECGTGYPVASAKFCCECGTRRLVLI